MARSRNSPRVERRRAAHGLLWGVLFAVIAALARNKHSSLQDLLTRVDISAALAARIVSILCAAAIVLAGLCLVGAVVHLVAWIHAAQQERWLADERRSMRVPPLASHLQVLTEGVGLVASAVFAAVGIGLLVLYATLASHPDVAAGFGLLLTGGGTVSFLDARRERRAVALSNLGMHVPTRAAVPPPPAREAAVPVQFEVFESSEEVMPYEIPPSPRGNIFGRPPWRILYLRLFANERGLSRVLSGTWRELGYVYFIRAAASVAKAEVKQAEAGLPVFVSSSVELEAELARQAQQTDLIPLTTRRFRPPLPSDRRVFPIRALLCHTAFWRDALDRLLSDADVVLLDLSGYQQANLGTAYELQRVIDTFPMRRCAVLLDQCSDLLFVKAHITHSWRQMAAASPNRQLHNHVVLLVVVPELIDSRSGERGVRHISAGNRQYTAGQLLQTRPQFVQLGRRLQDVLDSRR